MSSAYEPVLHALSVEPGIARPGDTVRLTFHTRNVGTVSSPPGTVAFSLPDGLEALAPAEVPLPSVEPGEPAIATICARVLPPLDVRAELRLQAVLVLPESRLATNVCVVRVRSRAVLDGAASGTFVEPADPGTVRVRAVVTNEGDGPALGVRLRLPPPAGCRRLDGEGDATLDAERLEPGDSLTLGFDARVEHVMPEVRAGTGEVRFGASTRRALPPRSALTVQPAIAAPHLTARSLRRRADVAVELRNDGWAHAHDTCVRIALPAGLRLDEQSVEIDGVHVAAAARPRRGTAAPIARLVSRSGTHAVVVSLLRARSTSRLTFSAHHAGDYDGGTLEVRVDERTAAVDYRAEPFREVRIEPLGVPSSVTPGETATIRARIVNAGDRAERLGIALMRAGVMEALPAERTIEPGACAVADLPLAVGAAAGDGLRLPFAVVVSDGGGERARADLEVCVRTPVAEDEPDDEAEHVAEPIVPAVHAALRAGDDAVAGAPLAVQLDIDAEDAVERLTIRVAELAGARYLAGTTSVGGCPILDGAGGSALHGDGLVVRAIPPATRVAIGWSVLVEPASADALAIGVELDADGHPAAPTPLAVRVVRADAFAARPAALPYHVDACALPARLAAAEIVEPSPAHDEPIDAGQPASPAAPTAPTAVERTPHWDEIARLLHGARCGGLVLHVLALRALFPEPGTRLDGTLDPALDAAGRALRDVFDRLFVKLRIPGFMVAADDLEDRRLRHALLALVDPDGTDARSAMLSDAPLGAPAVLRTVLAAIPAPACEPPLDALVGGYLHALDTALAGYEELPLELFDDALARGRDAALDESRAALLAVLDERVARRPIAC